MYQRATMLLAASLVLAATTSFAATGAHAQGARSSGATTGQGGQQGTAQERAACRSDVRRYCRSTGGDSMAALACLQSHRAQLSRSCRTVLEQNGQ